MRKFTGEIALEQDQSYVPCRYILCRVWKRYGSGSKDWNERDEETTTLIQPDFDYPGVASSFGWDMRSDKCGHSATDGTIDCPECGKTAGEFITEAAEYLDEIAGSGKLVEDPGYFSS